MADIKQCDVVVGEGNTLIAAGAYKVKISEDKEETRYKFGIRLNPPTKDQMGQELVDKFFVLGFKRGVSVDAASVFNKANDYGTKEDAEAFAKTWSSVEGCAASFEKAKREGGAPKVTTHETRAVAYLEDLLRQKTADGSIKGQFKVPIPRLDDPPKTAKGIVNYNAWAKIFRDEKHPWFDTAMKKTEVKADKDFS